MPCRPSAARVPRRAGTARGPCASSVTGRAGRPGRAAATALTPLARIATGACITRLPAGVFVAGVPRAAALRGIARVGPVQRPRS